MREPPVAQQAFLRDAMNHLKMTPDEFAKRTGTTRRRIDHWLLPPEAAEFREMDESAWKFVREILQTENKTV